MPIVFMPQPKLTLGRVPFQHVTLWKCLNMTRLSFGRTLAVVFPKEGNGGQGRRTELRHTFHSLYVIPTRLNLAGLPTFGHFYLQFSYYLGYPQHGQL